MHCLLVCLIFSILFQGWVSGLWMTERSDRPSSRPLSAPSDGGSRFVHFERHSQPIRNYSRAGGQCRAGAESVPCDCEERNSAEASRTCVNLMGFARILMNHSAKSESCLCARSQTILSALIGGTRTGMARTQGNRIVKQDWEDVFDVHIFIPQSLLVRGMFCPRLSVLP